MQKRDLCARALCLEDRDGINFLVSDGSRRVQRSET